MRVLHFLGLAAQKTTLLQFTFLGSIKMFEWLFPWLIVFTVLRQPPQKSSKPKYYPPFLPRGSIYTLGTAWKLHVFQMISSLFRLTQQKFGSWFIWELFTLLSFRVVLCHPHPVNLQLPSGAFFYEFKRRPDSIGFSYPWGCFYECPDVPGESRLKSPSN